MSFAYYQELKQLARKVRQDNGLVSPRVLKSDIKRIYKNENITLDYWPYPLKGLRGAYFNDAHGVSIMISKNLPDDPMIFTMAHELKHHLVDSTNGFNCLDKGDVARTKIEIGAEVFAAEFLFPEEIFIQQMADMGIDEGKCTAESIVRIKHETKTTLSFAGLVKRAEWLKFAVQGSLPKSGWKQLEEQIYGVPFYKRRRQKTYV